MMIRRIRRHITFANVVSMLALMVALAGTAFALAPNSVGSKEIKDTSVRSIDIHNASGVYGIDVANRSLNTVDLDTISRTQLRGTSFRVQGTSLAVSQRANAAAVSVTRPATGIYCVAGLPFTPVDAQVTVDDLAPSSVWGIAQVTVETGSTTCSSAADIAVFGFNANTGAAENESFYVHAWPGMS